MADDTRVTPSRPGFACALALLCVLGSLLPAVASASDIIVARDPGLSASERAEVRAGAGARLERTLPLADAEVVSVPDGQEQAALAALSADPGVRYAVPDVEVRAAAAPATSDAMWWELNNPNDADVDAPEAWASAYEGQLVTIGVVDMRIDADHPDLAVNVESAEDFVDPAKACQTTTLPTGGADHGTHVAGVIAAARDDKGIIGLAPMAHV